jgi:pimeloyl-ACP methyl ester carboxylesterase
MRIKTVLAVTAAVLLMWLFWPAATLWPTEHAPGSFVELSTGRIHYEEAGAESDGDPVVLLHGFAASSFSWRHTMPALARHRRVLAPDGLGFGFSDKRRNGDYSATAEVERIREFLDATGVERAVLAGNSMGGRNAALFAATYPERVSGLILINSAGAREEGRRGGGRLFRIPGFANAFMRIATSRPAIRAMLGAVYLDKNKVTDEVVEGYRKPLLVRGTPGVLPALSSTAEGPSLALLLPAIETPTLVVWGEMDPLFPLEQADFFLQIPDSRLVVIPRAAHLPHEEQPDEVNRALEQFLNQ